jgi:two-component system CheB/CheR fusion protein
MNDGHAAQPIALPKPVRTVAIGASAGGLDACKELFAGLPSDTGMAFIVVLHLDPSHESHLGELLARTTAMRVVDAASEVTLEADHVYVIVPDTSLEVRQGVLFPSRREEHGGIAKPIDTLFETLARDQGERAIAVVLSGNGDDGAAGLRSVKEAGGACLVQAPVTAAFDAMPRAAIATGCVDGVLEPSELGPALVDLAAGEGLNETSADAKVERSADADIDSDTFDEILKLVSNEHRVDFDNYRRGTLRRRISRRMGTNYVSDEADYLALLKRDPDELNTLYGDLLIDVTEFFRDVEVWDFLGDEVLPKIVASAEDDDTLRFWVPGCSTGEEAYTLAILVLEAIRAADRNLQIQIFATDINKKSIEVARRGFYPGTIAERIAPELLERYFHRQGDHFQVRGRVRELITFAVHDLLADPPFSRMNLVSCRNLLIYLEPEAQKRALDAMSYALEPRGYLVLGTAESIDRRSEGFDVISAALRVYRSTPDAQQSQRSPGWVSSFSGTSAGRPGTGFAPRPTRARGVERHLERYMLSHHAPAAVAINREFDILHFFGPTENYLVAPTGEAQLDLLAWVRPGLYANLQPALTHAVERGEPVDVAPMYVERDDEAHPVMCRVEPLSSLPGAEGLYLVTFRDMPTPAETEAGEQSEGERTQVKRLETQLRTMRREQRQLRERLEDNSEEYQAHHEELLSLNEELQSTNEELETSKEELQSLNEEMLTVNRELEEKNTELRELNTDLNNFLLSTDTPTIFLDKELRVRRFTPASRRVMRLVPSDIGRSIEHVKERFDDGHLIASARQVIDGEGPTQREVVTDDGRYYSERILPYRSDEGLIDGATVTFNDITRQKERAAQIEEARQYSEAIVRTIRTPLLVLDSDLHVISANPSFCRTFETSGTRLTGERIFEADGHQWDIPGLRSLLEKILPQRLEIDDYAIEHEFEHLGHRHLLLNARTMERPHSPPLILLSIEDVSARMSAELEAKRRAEQLETEHRRKDEFLAMLGHELRNPLAALSYGLEFLDEAKSDDPEGRGERTRQMMARQLQRMKLMLDQLLEMSRVSSGKIELDREPVDLSDVARHALELVEPLAEGHDHEVVWSLPSPGEVVVDGDSNRLAQVIENLLTNAIKYTPDGGRIELSLDSDSDSDEAVLTVHDSGVGIEPDLLPDIFEPFTQASRTLGRAEGGLGLGLSLARELVEMHGGSLTAHSDGPGKGSEFVITMPLTPTPLPARVPDVKDVPERERTQRVLIVDDEGDIADILGMILGEEGYDTRMARSGADAISVAREFDPEIVLLDLGLPDMSGYDVARKLRAEHGDSPFVAAVTGYTENTDELEAAGFDRHFIKPLQIEELISFLAELD